MYDKQHSLGELSSLSNRGDQSAGLMGTTPDKIESVTQQSKLRQARKRELEQLLVQPEIESWRTLMGAFQVVYRELERGLLSEKCSISRFQILFQLYFHGPLSAAEIARRLLVTRGNISMFLKRLEADGLARSRSLTKGGKRTLIELSPEGMRFFESLLPRHIERVKRLMPCLTPDTLQVLRELAAESSCKPTS